MAWQIVNGRKVDVPARYAVDAQGQVSFTLGAYDRSLPLTIDPTLTYSS